MSAFRYLKQLKMVKLGKQGRVWIMGFELDKKHATIAMRACYRSASKHPLVVVMIIFTIWFYRSFPLLFSLLLYASPVLISTATLLGTLLLFGHQKAPKSRKERKPHHHEIHNLIRVVEDTEFGGKGVRSEAPENAFERKSSVDNVNLNESDHRRVEINKRRSSIDSVASLSMADKQLKEEEAKSEVSNHNQKTDLGGDKVVFVSHCAQFQSPQALNTDDDHKIRSELPSPTASSMAGTFTMVDDLSPLMQPQANPHHAHTSGSEVHHHAHMSNANRYPASNHSLESDDDDDDDNEEEANASTWTEDDQKNLRNFGKSEVERNQHLESLVARQKALRNMRIQAEENLVNINLDISYSATQHASTRRNSFDQPYDLNETILESVPSVIMPIINPFEIPYDPNVDKSYPIGPTFQSDSLSFQPNNQFSHSHEGFDVGPTTLGACKQNEGYFTFGASENVSQRSRSSDDDDMAKIHQVARDGRVYEVQKSQPNDQFSHGHESSDVGPSTLMAYHSSKVSEYVNDDTMKLHQVAEGDHRHDEVKTSDGGEKGYQRKCSNESSSSSSFSDVTEHLDDEEEQYDFKSAVMPSTPEKQMQEQLKKEQHSNKQSPKSEHDEGQLSQRPTKGLTSWLVWKP